MSFWSAPTPDAPVTGTVSVPGSKSVTNRALLLAGLSGGDARVDGAPPTRDTTLMCDALAALGVPVTADHTDGDAVLFRAHPGLRGGSPELPAEVDCGLAGTVMRFVPPAAATAAGTVRFDGDPRARERPMGTVLSALRTLGARIDGDTLPFHLGGGPIAGGEVTVDASSSSQFVSGLLLSGALFERGVTVHHSGRSLPSLPHIDMTVAMLREAGVVVSDRTTGEGPDTWRVEPGPVTVQDRTIEPDLSNASVFLAAAVVTGGRVTVRDWPVETNQPGAHVPGVLEQFGASVTRDAGGLTVTGPDRLSGVDVDLRDAGELAPTIAAVAALAGGPSRLRGIGHLRGHETDRLAALAAEINALGGAVTETEDGLEIEPKPLTGRSDRSWGAYADHRMATAGAIVGLVVPGVQVDDIGCTDKTIPDFPGRWAALLDRAGGQGRAGGHGWAGGLGRAGGHGWAGGLGRAGGH